MTPWAPTLEAKSAAEQTRPKIPLLPWHLPLRGASRRLERGQTDPSGNSLSRSASRIIDAWVETPQRSTRGARPSGRYRHSRHAPGTEPTHCRARGHDPPLVGDAAVRSSRLRIPRHRGSFARRVDVRPGRRSLGGDVHRRRRSLSSTRADDLASDRRPSRPSRGAPERHAGVAAHLRLSRGHARAVHRGLLGPPERPPVPRPQRFRRRPRGRDDRLWRRIRAARCLWRPALVSGL